jgi:hypothetical protein
MKNVTHLSVQTLRATSLQTQTEIHPSVQTDGNPSLQRTAQTGTDVAASQPDRSQRRNDLSVSVDLTVSKIREHMCFAKCKHLRNSG